MTGIVRRIDELGRVVIPKELRRVLKLREGEELEVSASESGESLVLKKFSAMGVLAPFAKEYAVAIYETTGMTAFFSDLERVLYGAGDLKWFKEGEPLPKRTLTMLEERKTLKLEGEELATWLGREERGSATIAPILKDGDLEGAAILLSPFRVNELQLRAALTAARFLGKAIR